MHGLCSDPLSPIAFSYIIAQFCGTRMYIFFSVCSDAAGKLTIHKNGKGVNRMWVGIDERAEKGMGVIHCVGIGKPIAQIGLYIAVVCNGG